MKVKVTYFKESGKFYGEGEYETAMPEEEMWNLVEDSWTRSGIKRKRNLR